MTSDDYKHPDMMPETALVEGVDYVLENGVFVLTRAYLLARGYCCESGCRNCPYIKGKP